MTRYDAIRHDSQLGAFFRHRELDATKAGKDWSEKKRFDTTRRKISENKWVSKVQDNTDDDDKRDNEQELKENEAKAQTRTETRVSLFLLTTHPPSSSVPPASTNLPSRY